MERQYVFFESSSGGKESILSGFVDNRTVIYEFGPRLRKSIVVINVKQRHLTGQKSTTVIRVDLGIGCRWTDCGPQAG